MAWWTIYHSWNLTYSFHRKPLTEQMTKIEKEIEVQVQVDYHYDKMEYFENQSRRNNIRIYNT